LKKSNKKKSEENWQDKD